MKKKVSPITAAILIILAAAVALSIITSNPEQARKDSQDGLVYGMATHFVQKALKNPKSADFPSLSSVRVFRATQPNTWTVRGFVDASNSFGAVTRQHYEISLTYMPEKDTWKVNDLTFE